MAQEFLPGGEDEQGNDGAAGPEESEAPRETQREGRCLARGGRPGGLLSCRGGEAPKDKDEDEEPGLLKNGPGVPAGQRGHVDDACDRRCGRSLERSLARAPESKATERRGSREARPLPPTES